MAPVKLRLALCLSVSLSSLLTTAQIIASPISNTFASNVSLSASRASFAELNPSEAAAFSTVVNNDLTQLAPSTSYPSSSSSEPAQDPFYTLPTNLSLSTLYPGRLLKLEPFTPTGNYTLAPNTALSRFIYVSETLNGTLVPVSAFILWPFTPRPIPGSASAATGKAHLILWNHMTSSFFAPHAPSAHRSLWAGDAAPFPLALAGYVVVASDYAGIGLSRGFEGEEIKHEYLAMPAAAKDGVWALTALREWAEWNERVGQEWVSVGQSQGGGVSWGVAELLATTRYAGLKVAEGYRGSVGVSPTVRSTLDSPFLAAFVAMGVGQVFPGFELGRWLTELGTKWVELYRSVKGGLAAAITLFSSRPAAEIARVGWNETWEARAYAKLADVGEKEVRGPLLVIQGTEDAFVFASDVEDALMRTCEVVPGNEIGHWRVNGTGHVPTLDATRMRWMKWIEERFEGKATGWTECGETEEVESWLPIERYQKTWNSIPLWVGRSDFLYAQPLGL